MVKFSNQKCLVYHCTFVTHPINTNQVQLKWPSIGNAQEKAKEKGEKEREKGGKNVGSNRKKNPKNISPMGVANSDPRGMVDRIYVGDHLTSLHT